MRIKRKIHRLSIIGVVGLLLALLSTLLTTQGVKADDPIETVIPSFWVDCSSTGRLCDPPFSVTVETGSLLQVHYFVPNHCWSIRLHIFVDGSLKTTTGFLGWPGAEGPYSGLPLDTGLLNLGPVAPGTHLVSLQAESLDGVGGCSGPTLVRWGGKLVVFTSPLVTEAQIDIKPGSFPNNINPRSQGKLPVAILTDSSFDAGAVDLTTVHFGATGIETSPVHWALEDVDGDGDIDMILHFNTQATGIVCGATSASLTGKLFSGQAIVGSDSIETVGCK